MISRPILQLLLWSFALLLPMQYSIAAPSTGTSAPFHDQLKNYCKNLKCEPQRTKDPASAFSALSIVTECQNFYLTSNCAEFKDSLGKDRASTVISCEPEELCQGQAESDLVQCTIAGVRTQFSLENLGFLAGGTLAAAVVGNSVAIATATFLPFLIYGAGQQAEACNSDLKYKSMAVKIHNLSLLPGEKPLDLEGKDKSVLNMQCSDLRKFLQTRLEVLSQKRASEKMWSLNPTPPVQQSEASRTFLDQMRSKQCLNRAEMKKQACEMIAGFVTGTAIGGVTGRLTAKLSGGLVRTAVATRTSGTFRFRSCSGDHCLEQIEVKPHLYEHVEPHRGWSEQQKAYLQDALQAREKGLITNSVDADYWFDGYRPSSAKVGKGNPNQTDRPFRKGKPTSVFPDGVTAEEIVRELPNLAAKKIPNKVKIFDSYEVEYRGNRYEISVCNSECQYQNGQSLSRSEVATIYPICGPNVRNILPLAAAKKLLLSSGTLSRDSFLQPSPCP